MSERVSVLFVDWSEAAAYLFSVYIQSGYSDYFVESKQILGNIIVFLFDGGNVYSCIHMPLWC